MIAALAVRFTFLFAAIALPSLFVTVIKRLIGRARPFVGGEADPFQYLPLVWRSEYASLPSGHATTAFAALIAVGLVWPRLRMVMWVYALIIALSRVVVLAHHPSDVVAGAIVGAVGAWLVRDWFAAPARLRGRCGRARSHAAGALVRTHQKGCPQASRPIRSSLTFCDDQTL